MVVKHCCYGLCTSDSRYHDKLAPGTFFIPFAKPGVVKENMDVWMSQHQKLKLEKAKGVLAGIMK